MARLDNCLTFFILKGLVNFDYIRFGVIIYFLISLPFVVVLMQDKQACSDVQYLDHGKCIENMVLGCINRFV